MTTKENLDVVKISAEDVGLLKSRIAKDEPLSQSDRNILLAVLSVYFWLQAQLQQAKLSLLRLKKIADSYFSALPGLLTICNFTVYSDRLKSSTYFVSY